MLRWINSRVLPVLALFVAGACSNTNEPATPVNLSQAPVFGKASTLPTPAVTSTTPSSGEQGEVQKTVVINGSGFAAGAIVAWERGGLADSHITVHSATVVSATRIDAVISIAPDADVTLYDVSVTNVSLNERKKGIGTEVFAVKVRVTGQTPVATWYFPTSDSGLAVRGDGQYVSGGNSVYANGVCGVEAKMFPDSTYDAVNSFDPAGDATIGTSTVGGGKSACTRKFTLVYPDGQTESVKSFNRVSQFANKQYSIPIGTTIRRKLIVNPSYVGSVSRCDRLLFGQNVRPSDGVLIGVGSDSVLVTRINARTWRVKSESADLSKALCEKTGEIFKMPVDFTIEAGADFPL